MAVSMMALLPALIVPPPLFSTTAAISGRSASAGLSMVAADGPRKPTSPRKLRKPLDLPPFEPPPKPRRRLAGSFIPSSDTRQTLVNGFDYDDTTSYAELRNIDEDAGEYYASEPETGEALSQWSPRAVEMQSFWSNATRRESIISKRRATIAGKRAESLEPPKPPKRPMSPSAQVRSEALKLRYADEDAWMSARLASGAEKRARLNNDAWKRERQRQRSEVARARSAAKKKAAAEMAAAKTKAGDAPQHS